MIDAASAPGPTRQVAWLMDRSTDAAMLTDAQGRIEYVNPAFETLTGWAQSEVIGRTPALLKSGLQAPELYRQLWRAVSSGQEFRGVLVNRRRNGELYHEEKSVRPLFDAQGRITHLLSCGRDVSDRVAAMAQLRHTATHDALTGLPNRALFVERVESALTRLRQGGAGLAVVLVDVDAFKCINDVHGHAAGDAVLQVFAERMQLSVRKADTVARLGGDEFALLLEGVDDERMVASLLAGLARALAEPVAHGSGRLPASASLGACLDTGGAVGLQRLLELADLAMYQAKREHPGGWRIVLPDCDTASAPLEVDVAAEEAAVPGPLNWRRRELRAGDALYREGQRFSEVCVIRQGAARVERLADANGGASVELRGAGEWLGLDGCATRRHRREVVMHTDAVLWTVGYDELLAAARAHPELLNLLLDALNREAAR